MTAPLLPRPRWEVTPGAIHVPDWLTLDEQRRLVAAARPYTDVELRSGDLFVFGGPSRLAYHGVPRTLPGTGDPATGLRGGRLNITLRVTGLSDSGPRP